MAELDWDIVREGVINAFDELKRKQTNADRIRAMSDKELANFLVDISVDPVSRCGYCADAKRCTNKCIGGIMRWLQQPAEVD